MLRTGPAAFRQVQVVAHGTEQHRVHILPQQLHAPEAGLAEPAELLQQRDGTVPPILQQVGVDPARVASDVKAQLDRLPKVYGAETYLGSRLRLGRGRVLPVYRGQASRGCHPRSATGPHHRPKYHWSHG